MRLLMASSSYPKDRTCGTVTDEELKLPFAWVSQGPPRGGILILCYFVPVGPVLLLVQGRVWLRVRFSAGFLSLACFSWRADWPLRIMIILLLKVKLHGKSRHLGNLGILVGCLGSEDLDPFPGWCEDLDPFPGSQLRKNFSKIMTKKVLFSTLNQSGLSICPSGVDNVCLVMCSKSKTSLLSTVLLVVLLWHFRQMAYKTL